MAAYNHERFIVDAVESALAIEWPSDRLEIIVVDDGSTDATADRLEPYRERIRVIRQENRGLHAAVGRLMDEARGEVIVTGPAGDDMAVPGRARILVDALRANPNAGLAYSDMEVIDDAGATTAPSYMDLHGLDRPSGRVRGRLLQGNFVSGGSCAMRGCLKDVFHPIPSYAAWEDMWWAWSTSGVADLVHVPAITYRYRQHGANLAHGATGARAVDAMETELGFRRWMFGAIRPSEVTADELLHGLRTFYQALLYIAQLGNRPFGEGLVADEEDELAADTHFQAALRAMQEGDVFGAALAAARWAAASPRRMEDPSLVAKIFEAHTIAPALQLTTQRFVVVADGDELVQRPDLLEAYGRSFGVDDDTTLIIHTPGWSSARTAEVLPALVAQAGLDGDDGPDMMALTHVPGGRAAVVRRADALLSAEPCATMPSFGTATIEGLRELERCSARALGPAPWRAARVAALAA